MDNIIKEKIKTPQKLDIFMYILKKQGGGVRCIIKSRIIGWNTGIF